MPAERCLAHGPGVLTDAELLAAILRHGRSGEDVLSLSRRILRDHGPLRELMRSSPEQLVSISGIGRARAAMILCSAELGRRAAVPEPDRPLLSDPDRVAQHYMGRLSGLPHETFVVACLNTKNRLLRDCVLFQGTVSETVVSPREIYREALRCGAARILVLHNHPSGDPTPSRADMDVTKRIAKAGEMLGIPLVDHMVIGDGTYISFLKQGYL